MQAAFLVPKVLFVQMLESQSGTRPVVELWSNRSYWLLLVAVLLLTMLLLALPLVSERGATGLPSVMPYLLLLAVLPVTVLLLEPPVRMMPATPLLLVVLFWMLLFWLLNDVAIPKSALLLAVLLAMVLPLL